MGHTFLEQLNSAFIASTDEQASLDVCIEKLEAKQDLSPSQAVSAIRMLMSDTSTDQQKAAFLTAMRVKQVTVDELAAFDGSQVPRI